MDVFAECDAINDLLLAGDDSGARNQLIKLLALIEDDGLQYSPLVNSLIREVGLFPYLEPETAAWQERFVWQVFKADVGGGKRETLHREQSRLLYSLLAGKSIAVSAPTSFGKSFVIDSFIAIKQPANVVILVPTIALADETRRRLQRKFGAQYKIITTADQSVSEKNIFIFPQERAIRYAQAIDQVDILIVDEFYKASKDFDRDRSPSLIKAIMSLSAIADQRYFLAPNIDGLKKNVFTEGMEFLRLDFNTVVLEKHDLSAEIGRDEQKKSDVLLDILAKTSGKTLVYAGTYANIGRVSNLLMTSLDSSRSTLLAEFQSWLSKNYDPNWALPKLVIKGVGIHNGRLHRSLSQIQVKLFDEPEGLNQIVSTSSIIEGVNTSAETVVLWSNRNGRARINDFTYKNIIGRGGRMFRHFVGKIFVLEEPPAESETQLELELPDELLGTFDEDAVGIEFTSEQAAVIEKYKNEMKSIVGSDNFDYFREQDAFQSNNSSLILRIATDIVHNRASWNGLGNLNSQNPEKWEHYLYRLMNLQPGVWGIEYRKYVGFVQTLYDNWTLSISDLLRNLSPYDIELEQFFELERNTTFKLSALLSDVQTIYNRINPTGRVDLSPAISGLSHAFLPPVVYQLEEYGIPRMISRKIQNSGLLDLESVDDGVHGAIEQFQSIGFEGVVQFVNDLDPFDRYILQYFFDGIDHDVTVQQTYD